MENIRIVFRASLLLLVFMCGIMTGKSVEEKNIRMEKELVYDTEEKPENLLVSLVEGIRVYYDSWEPGRINLIIDNREGDKLSEVSIMNMEVDGLSVDTYSCLDGIHAGEIKKCAVKYDGDVLKEKQNTPKQIKGDLYVRGSRDFVYQKIVIFVEGGISVEMSKEI